MKPLFITFATLALVVGVVSAQGRNQTQSSAPDAAVGDWITYGGTLAGTRHSGLTDITPANVGTLKQAWAHVLTTPGGGGRRGRGAPAAGAGEARGGRAAAPARGAAPTTSSRLGILNPVDPSGVASTTANPEATPIAINGVVYLPAAGHRVLALDGTTGEEIWTFDLPAGQETTARGVAYWGGDRSASPRIVFSAGPRLYALDAATGKPVEGFGTEGSVDITVPWNGVPLIYKNIAMLGATTGEVPDGLPGDTRAFDVRTGKKLWEFHTVPRPGEKGHDTWLNDGWKNRSGTNVWTWSMTLDEQRGILYMPVAGPAANYWGADRPGANLFANSIVAVDANTGAYKWHFQTVHHDLWDSDMSNPPALVDITQNGRRIPALAFIGKTGWMFILDRTNGKPIFGVEERPVAKGDVPGEWYSPTQPFPLKPGPISRVEFVKERDLVRAEDTSADHVAACEAYITRAGGLRNEGPFTPFNFKEHDAPPKSTIQLPGGTGGVNWGGVSADPQTGLVFMNANDTSLVGWVENRREGETYGRGTEGSKQPMDRASVSGAGPYASFTAPMRTTTGGTINLPCTRPPWGELVAVNANTGEIAWRTPLGVYDNLPEGKQNLGNSGSAGPMTTASGLVFIGATNDRRFRAFDAKTGRELWATNVGQNVNANPMSYRGKDGKQYVAVVANSQLLAFALP